MSGHKHKHKQSNTMNDEFFFRPESDPTYQLQQYILKWKVSRPQIDSQLGQLPPDKVQDFKDSCARLLEKDILQDLKVPVAIEWSTTIEIISFGEGHFPS